MILLATHSGADFDALASLMLASKLYPRSKIFLSPGPGKKVRKFLEKEGFPGEIAKEEELENLKADILVLLDTSSIRRAGGAGQFLNPKTEIHIYDHHPPRQSDLDAAVEVRRKTGATATILVGLLREKGIILSPEEATLAALGVSEDTGGLTFPNTTNEDKEVFRYLLKIGANLSLIANYTEETLDAKHKKLLEDLLENKKELDTAYGKITILSADINEYIEDLSLSVQRAVELISPEVLIAFINTGEKLICIARSATEKFKAGKIFSEFGGGGHATAASVTVNSSDFHLKKRIIHHLKTSRPPDEKIIINPARILPSSNTAIEAYRSMLHLNQRRAPVGDASGKLRGIVERKELRKALRHNLANQPVTEFLSGRAPSAPDNLPSEILEKKLAAGGYGFLVLKNGNTVTGIAEESFRSRKKFSLATDRAKISMKMEKVLDPDVTEILKEAGRLAESMGLEAYCVGGMVRDILMGSPHKDLDLTVSSSGIQFARKLAKKLKGSCTTHLKFNTALIRLKDRKIDIATLRNEYYEFPGALPDLSTGDIKQDLYRRDFTINAMAVKLNPPDRYGEILDYFGGRDDLIKGRISILYPLSFIEDPTRILRGVRFEKRYGFIFSSDTLAAARRAISESGRFKISPYRIKEELTMILSEDSPADIFRRLSELDVLKFFNPPLRLSEPILRLLEKYPPDEMPEDLKEEALELSKESLLLVLLSNFHKANGVKFLEYYNYPKDYKEKYLFLMRNKDRLISLLSKSLSNVRIYKALNKLPLSLIYTLAILGEGRRSKDKIFNYLLKLRTINAGIGGENLIKLGIKPGPVFSKILYQAKLLRLNNPSITPGEIEQYIINIYK